LVPSQQKEAAVVSLMNHEDCLKALHKTAMVKAGEVRKQASVATEERPAEAMGGPMKTAVSRDIRDEPVRDSDRTLLRNLGFTI
jgi:hypothetical protein